MTIMLNNLRRVFKSKGHMIIMLVLPLVFITLIMMSSFSGSKISVGIVDNDKTKYTKMLADYVGGQNNVVFLESGDIHKKLINGNVNYVLEIGKGFTDKLIKGQNPTLGGYSVQESNISLPTKYGIESFISSSKNIAISAHGDEESFYKSMKDYSNGSFTVSYDDVENTKSKGINTVTALGFLIMSMLMLSNVSAQFILDDKKNKTFFRIFASPISSRNYMVQNILSFFLILAIQMVIIFAIMIFGFKAYFGPSALNVFLLFLVFSAVCVSLGVAIASVSKDSRQAGALNTLITIPMCMLGGCFWQRSVMPDMLQKAGEFMPTTWVIRAADSLVSGTGFTGIYKEIGILLLFTLVFVLLGSWKKVDVSR